MNRTVSNPWIPYCKSNLQSPLRLFCFSYAGAGASIFCPWMAHLAPAIEVCPVQLPGRENRLSEPPFTHISPLIESLTHNLLPYLDRPFAFFGHSVGALVAFEFARYLRRHAYPQPRYLFVSGRQAPHIPPSSPPIHQLPDAEFIEELRRYNGTPDTFLQNPELLELFLPILRADFSINETYHYTSESPFDFPISAFGGVDDPEATQDEIDSWRQETLSNYFSLTMLPGDHFFIKSHPMQVLAKIDRQLKEMSII